MNFLDWTWNYIIVFLIVLTVLIYVHEWGHYWVAKRNGVRVDVFSIGFGPEVFGWTNNVGTRWKIGLIPLGGYVKMFGEEDGREDEDSEDGKPIELTEEEKAVSFHHKTLGQRAAIVAAGPIVNFLFAIAIFAGLAMFHGNPVPLAVIGEVVADSSAAKAGMKRGDKVLRIDGVEIKTFEELRQIVIKSPGKPLVFQIDRDGHIQALSPKPKARTTADGQKMGQLGVRPHADHIRFDRYDPFTAVWVGIERTAILTYRILDYIGDMFSGARTTDDLGGPLRIAQISGEMAQMGMTQVILLMAMLSVNLGLINLFPIPMLDGGHLAFYAIEALRGKPLGPTAQEYGFRFGLILVLLLVVFVTWNDLVHLEVIKFIKEIFV